SIIIMTSNLGARFLQKQGHMGFRTTPAADVRKTGSMIQSEVKKAFNPEFLNRLDETIVFEALTDDDLERIVDLLIQQGNEVLRQRKIKISLNAEARKWVVRQTCRDRSYGARPLRRAIQKYIEDPLAEALIQNRFKPESVLEIYLEGDSLYCLPAGEDRQSGVLLTVH
ncbi:MAG: ATP-dependent Clp protease ATP-binding subunit, partial [Acidobacteria bacterium]|nr:ATP-dependent Clp protease ATP-binding subunit [Acidobacteriota bacterium]